MIVLISITTYLVTILKKKVFITRALNLEIDTISIAFFLHVCNDVCITV